MDKIKKLANKVMKKANDFTGWRFTVSQQDGSCRIGTTLARKDQNGQELHVVFDVECTGATINVFVPKCRFEEKTVGKVLENIEFPIEVKGNAGEMLIIRSCVPLDLLESDTDIIVEDMMVLMVDAMTKIVVGS